MPKKLAAKKPKSSKQALPSATIKEMANRLNPNSPYYEHEQNKRPHFAVFLGAGASIESGVNSANQMTADFIKRICAVECPENKKDGEKDKWLKDNKYYETGKDKYGSLFERCFPTEVDRREYIESQVDGKVPSLGYIALAHLIKTKIVDTIITTNFDDLIYIACTSYTDIRPVVYSLGGFASEISGTTNRPRVLKLHGDFLFSSLKNTENELQKQDVNMSQQVHQILEAYRGIIVIGYSGNDDSIIELLSTIPDGKYFYWCVYKDEQVSESVEKLIREKKGWIVRTDGFDKLFDEIRKVVGIKDEDVFNLFDERRKKIEKELKKFNPEEFDKFDEANKFYNEGVSFYISGKFKKAEAAYRKAIEISPNYFPAYHSLAILLERYKSHWDEVESLYQRALELRPDSVFARLNLDLFSEKRKSKE
jgi:tetratricopeptide (TPR) repeat protein